MSWLIICLRTDFDCHHWNRTSSTLENGDVEVIYSPESSHEDGNRSTMYCLCQWVVVILVPPIILMQCEISPDALLYVDVLSTTRTDFELVTQRNNETFRSEEQNEMMSY